MTPEAAIQFVDEVLLSLNDKPLTDIQRMILRESLAGKSFDKMSGYSTSHTKTQGSILWALLTAALKEKIGKKSCKGVLEKRLRAGRIDPKQPMLSTYNEQTWVGRETLIGDLVPKLQGQTRLLWITGISGIGKTAFGECLANHVWKSDPSFQWIYLEILEGQSPNFTSVAAELLAKLGDSELSSQEQNNPDLLAKRLFQKLRSYSYWLQLDSLERLLDLEQPNEFIDSYWVTFLQRCLTDSNIISRLVLTAQVLPTALIEFSDRYSNTWSEYRLGGLLKVDRQLEFFAKRKVVVKASNRDILIRIATIYEGHPLVLKIIAEDIVNSFVGDVLSFWQIYQPEFEQDLRELQANHLNEIEYNEALYRKVRERIRRSLERIPTEALNLLCRSAVFRRPVPKKFWLAMLEDYYLEDKKAAYRILEDRALIEKENAGIRQHNLIRSIAYGLLKADILTWQKAERQAAYLWLTDYQCQTNAPNVETVRGYLEAFNHYLEAEDWASAAVIPYTKIGIDNELHQQLFIWGYFQELVPLYHKLLLIMHKTENQTGKGTTLGALGTVYHNLGMSEQSLNFQQQYLVIMREIKDLDGEGRALGNLGNVHHYLGQYEKAIDFHQQHLVITQKTGDHKNEGCAFANIGNVYHELGQYEEALNYNQQALVINEAMNNRWGKGTNMGNRGLIYCSLGDYVQAINYHNQHLIIAKELGDRAGEGRALGNMGLAYYYLGEYEEAVKFSKSHLNITQEIGNRNGEAIAFGNLGDAYLSLEDYHKALEFQNQKLLISRETHNLGSECYALSGLGKIYIELGKHEDALTSLTSALKISREISKRPVEAKVLKTLALLHQLTDDLPLASEYCEQALLLATTLGMPLMKECEALLQQLRDLDSAKI